jgi:hypothetical protein
MTFYICLIDYTVYNDHFTRLFLWLLSWLVVLSWWSICAYISLFIASVWFSVWAAGLLSFTEERMWCKSRSLEERFQLQEAYDAGPVLGLNRKINGPSFKDNLVKIPPGLYTSSLIMSISSTSKTLRFFVNGCMLILGMLLFSCWCGVNLDHSKRGLNFKKPMTRGRY